jgi:hypothetical protein
MIAISAPIVIVVIVIALGVVAYIWDGAQALRRRSNRANRVESLYKDAPTGSASDDTSADWGKKPPMGFLAKRQTTARTAPLTVASRVPSGMWLLDGVLRIAAMVRAASCVIGSENQLLSSSFRGSDYLGIGSNRRTGASTIWVEQATLEQWDVSLGAATVGGAALDWRLEIKVRLQSDADALVVLSTPTVLTKDGQRCTKMNI